MPYRSHVDSLTKIMDNLSHEDAIILVEGKRDYKALANLGIPKERIVQCAQRAERDLEPIIMTHPTKAIPLFDNDTTGKLRSSRFCRYFNGQIPIDYSYSQRLFRLGLTYIEELNNRMLR